MSARNKRRTGQALVMVTLALFAMMGIIGLAVDLGWSFYVKKTAQAAADAAAIAATQRALDQVGQAGTITCGVNAQCTGGTLYNCPEPPAAINTNLDSGCAYAGRNAFAPGGSRTVNLDSDVPANRLPPTVLGTVSVDYWVTVRSVQTVPQLFSIFLGNRTGTVAARATAAIVDSTVIGSLILLNREGDWAGIGSGGRPLYGINIHGQANVSQVPASLRAAGGILMASTCHGNCPDNTHAGVLDGGTAVSAPFTYIRGLGDVSMSNNATWVATPESGKEDGSFFMDPMRGKGQPPPPTGLTDRPIVGGMIDGTRDPATLAPGNYYAVDAYGNPTGEPITLTGNITFASAGFGGWVFFGGVAISQTGQGATNITFGPGTYVFAGVKPTQNGNAKPLFDVSVSGSVTLQSSGSGPDYPGSIFIFTDPNYVGGTAANPRPLEVPAALNPTRSSLKQGTSGFQTGNNPRLMIDLNGLNEDSGALPPGRGLEPFSSVIVWQDQRNSTVKYNQDGHVACGNGASACEKTPAELAADGVVTGSPNLYFQASPQTHLNGTVYQPRGAWTTMVGGGGYFGPLKIITGSFDLQASSAVQLLPTQNTLKRKIVALIE